MINKRVILAGLIGFGAWKLFLKTAVVGYNLEYGFNGVSFVGHNDEDVIFDVALKITNPLPFDTFIHKVDLNFAFNGGLLAQIRQHINRPCFGKTAITTIVRVFIKKSFFEEHFLNFIASGDYSNFVININGLVTIDNIKDFRLNIDLTLYDFLKDYAKGRQ